MRELRWWAVNVRVHGHPNLPVSDKIKTFIPIVVAASNSSLAISCWM